MRRIVPKIIPKYALRSIRVPAAHTSARAARKICGEGVRGLEPDAGAELCLPAGAKVVAVEGALEVWRSNRGQVQGLLASRRIDSGVADRNRAVQRRIETPAPVLVQQIEQIEHIHRQLDPRPAAGRHGDAITEIEAVDPR